MAAQLATAEPCLLQCAQLQQPSVRSFSLLQARVAVEAVRLVSLRGLYRGRTATALSVHARWNTAAVTVAAQLACLLQRAQPRLAVRALELFSLIELVTSE